MQFMVYRSLNTILKVVKIITFQIRICNLNVKKIIILIKAKKYWNTLINFAKKITIMLLSQSCKAAIKSLVFIASKSESGVKTGIKDITKEIGENEHTIAKTLQILVKQGVLSSQRGPVGGFYLTNIQLKINMFKVVEAIDGNLLFKECVLGFKECNSKNPCPMHHSFSKVRDDLYKIFKENTIQSLCDSIQNGESYLLI